LGLPVVPELCRSRPPGGGMIGVPGCGGRLVQDVVDRQYVGDAPRQPRQAPFFSADCHGRRHLLGRGEQFELGQVGRQRKEPLPPAASPARKQTVKLGTIWGPLRRRTSPGRSSELNRAASSGRRPANWRASRLVAGSLSIVPTRGSPRRPGVGRGVGAGVAEAIASRRRLRETQRPAAEAWDRTPSPGVPERGQEGIILRPPSPARKRRPRRAGLPTSAAGMAVSIRPHPSHRHRLCLDQRVSHALRHEPKLRVDRDEPFEQPRAPHEPPLRPWEDVPGQDRQHRLVDW